MYLPASLVLALFPMVAESHALRQNPKPYLWKAIAYTLLLSGTGTLIYWLFPDIFLRLLLGIKYLQAAPLLGLYGIAMLPMALLLVLINYYIARGANVIWLLCGSGAVIEILLISLRHAHLRQVLEAVFIGGMLSLLLCLYPVLKDLSSSGPFPQPEDPGDD